VKSQLIAIVAAVLLVGTAFPDPIHDAASNGDLASVQAELDKGVDVNAKREGGSTPLHGAAEGGHEEIVELLIVAGADLHARTVPMLGGGGWTPLHSAAKHGHKEIVELLIANGTDVNSRDSTGKSSLHDAALEGHKEIVELLIIKGADLNAESGYYGTPLHVAAGIGHKEIVELLIANSANVNVKDGFGRTPLDVAELVYEWDSTEAKAAKKNIADVIRKHQLIPRLTYSRGLFGFSFITKDDMTYVVEVTQDFKQWGELETIKGTGKQIKFTDPRQPLLPFKRNFYRVKVVE
jgi:hypothetical protein